jgi:hypothetical protein
LEKNLEKLGSAVLQNFHMAGYQQAMLDSRPPSQARAAPPSRLSILWSGRGAIQHLLISCVFTQQVCALILQHLNLVTVAPSPMTSNFSGWCRLAIRTQKGAKVDEEGLEFPHHSCFLGSMEITGLLCFWRGFSKCSRAFTNHRGWVVFGAWRALPSSVTS